MVSSLGLESSPTEQDCIRHPLRCPYFTVEQRTVLTAASVIEAKVLTILPCAGESNGLPLAWKIGVGQLRFSPRPPSHGYFLIELPRVFHETRFTHQVIRCNYTFPAHGEMTLVAYDF